MLFQTPQFFIFLSVVFALLAVLKRRQAQVPMLLIASYVFYMCWSPLLILPILASTAGNFYATKRIYALSDAIARRRWLYVTVILNLCLLGWFKYYNFFVGSYNSTMDALGIGSALPILNIILPVGISFYTFEAISYAVDVYHDKYKPCEDLVDFAVYLAYFPHLVAGPILRPWDFVPQIQKPLVLRGDNLRAGSYLFLVGLFKKVVVADNLAPFSDGVLLAPQGQSSLIIILGTLAYGVRIYCDFSGYTDMARGVSRMMGIELPLNFDRPYLALRFQDFWRRWHISLSSWLRDYLYIPLGGSRKGEVRTYVNLMLTMLLGGLWHGAAWNFVLWGGYQGLLLSVDRLIYGRWGKQPAFQKFCESKFGQVVQWVVTQYFVFMGWIFFVVSKPEDIFYCIKKYMLFDMQFSLGGAGLGTLRPITVVLLLGTFALLHAGAARLRGFDSWFLRLAPPFRFALYVMTAITLIFFWPTEETPFVYFQF